MNRNQVAKYLDMLLISGQVEMQIIGAAKVYFLSHRVPISAMLEFSTDYVVVVDTEQRVIQVNEPVLKLLNKKRESLIGKKSYEIDDPFFSNLSIPDPVRNGQRVDAEKTEISIVLNEKTHHFRLKLVPTAFEDGSQGTTFIIEDITAKKTYEENLQMSEARYRGIVEDQTEFITRFRTDGTLIFLNDSYARYLGKRTAELQGRYHLPGIDEEDNAELNHALQSLDKEHPVKTVECRVLNQSNQVRWNLWTFRALFDDSGVIREYQGVGKDITEKRETGEKIKNYIRTMEFLSETGKAFMDMDEGDDIYRYVAQKVFDLAPGFLVWVGILDEAQQKLILIVSLKSTAIEYGAVHGSREDMTSIEKADKANSSGTRNSSKPLLFSASCIWKSLRKYADKSKRLPWALILILWDWSPKEEFSAMSG
jgi:PAS domain S-box-containing protein